MTKDLTVLLGVLAANSLVAILYFLICTIFRKKIKKGYGMRTLVMLLCPLVGPGFFALSYVLYKIFMSEPVSLEDVVFSKDRVKTISRPDEEKERNTVSLEEAIEIMDKDRLRDAMMNVVAGDINKSLATISRALSSNDSETSHYAASVLVDALNDFRQNVEKQYKLMQEEDPTKTRIGEMLLNYMNDILAQKVFTDIEQRDHVEKMDQVGEFLYNKNKSTFLPAYYEHLCMRLLEIEDFEKCEKWCGRVAAQFPNTLVAFTCQLKLYFETENQEKFFQVMDELKKSDVVIDRETLEMVRIFM